MLDNINVYLKTTIWRRSCKHIFALHILHSILLWRVHEFDCPPACILLITPMYTKTTIQGATGCKHMFTHILHSIHSILLWLFDCPPARILLIMSMYTMHIIGCPSAGILLIIPQCPSFSLLLLLLTDRYAVKHLLILHSVLWFTLVVRHCLYNVSIALHCIILQCLVVLTP